MFFSLLKKSRPTIKPHRLTFSLFCGLWLALWLTFGMASNPAMAANDTADKTAETAETAETEETIQPQGPLHALAMHGAPKYGPDFTHFDYVNPEAPKGGTLRLHAIGSYDSLNPFIVKGSPAGGLSFLGTNLLYESLMKQSYDEPFTMYGLLAESVEVGEDRSWVKFNLRPEARWADGEPVTAGDVVWTFNTMMEKGTPFFKAYYGDVEKVEALSPREVKFSFRHNENAELPLVISQLSILPKHYWEQEGRDISNTTLEAPLGSGPYQISSVVPGRSIEYKKNPQWWGEDLPINRGHYNFDNISYDYYRDANVALEAFFAGEYDVRQENTAKLWATAYDAPPVQSGDIIKEEIPHEQPTGMQGFIYNIRRPVFADPAVREALAHAFDFEWSNKQFAYGSYKRSHSYFSNSELAATGVPEGRELEILEPFRDQLPPQLFTTEYNPPSTDGSGNNRQNLRQAMKILEEAGYKTGPDGIRVHEKTGQKLTFEIIDTNPAFERWVLPFIQNLKKIGVEANFRVVDPAQYQNLMSNFDYDMTVMSFGQSASPGNEQRDFWGSEKATMPGSRNYIGIQDPVVDQLIEMIIKAPSREELVYRTRALDRVLQWGFYLVPNWHIDYWRIAWWDKLAHPDQLAPMSPLIADTWWVKPE